MMIQCTVEHVEIVHHGNFDDGFPTRVLVEGKSLMDRIGENEKTITLIAEALKPLEVQVLTSKDKLLSFLPQRFDLTLGELRVLIHPDRRPTMVMIGETDVKARSLKILFAEGEAVWVDLIFMPNALWTPLPIVVMKDGTDDILRTSR